MQKKYKVEEITNKSTWEEFVLSRNPKSFLQSWNYGETHKYVGDKIFRLGFFKGNNLVGVSLIIEQKARRGLHYLIPGGPIINWDDRPLVDFLIKFLKEFAKNHGVWFIRVRPEILDSPISREMFSNLGFINAPMHLQAEVTWILDISQSEDKLLSEMRKTTRYLIRKSLKYNLRFETSSNPKDSYLLEKLQKETVKRHGFVGFSGKVFKGQIATFGKDKQAGIFYCKKGKDILAASIIIFYGDTAYYHHSGSSSRYKEIPFSYFLQWKIIETAKKLGLKYYNMWGIAPTDNPRHRFAGVTLFKKGFGGYRVGWLHAQDLPISPLYYLTFIFESARKLFRRL